MSGASARLPKRLIRARDSREPERERESIYRELLQHAQTGIRQYVGVSSIRRYVRVSCIHVARVVALAVSCIPQYLAALRFRIAVVRVGGRLHCALAARRLLCMIIRMIYDYMYDI